MAKHSKAQQVGTEPTAMTIIRRPQRVQHGQSHVSLCSPMGSNLFGLEDMLFNEGRKLRDAGDRRNERTILQGS